MVSFIVFYSHLYQIPSFFLERKLIRLSPKENILRRLFETKSKLAKPLAGVENKQNCLLEKSEKSGAIDFKEVYAD